MIDLEEFERIAREDGGEFLPEFLGFIRFAVIGQRCEELLKWAYSENGVLILRAFSDFLFDNGLGEEAHEMRRLANAVDAIGLVYDEELTWRLP